jgi:hypothetical protein
MRRYSKIHQVTENKMVGAFDRMKDNAMPKRMLKGRPYSKGRKGRPKMRLLDEVESDLKRMKVKGWKERMRKREPWRLVTEDCNTEWCKQVGSFLSPKIIAFMDVVHRPVF